MDAAKRGADAVDLRSFQRSLSAAIFNLSEGRLGQAAAVVLLAEFALAALVEVMERADDSDGYISTWSPTRAGPSRRLPARPSRTY